MTCEEKHRANLGWTAAELQRVGHHIVAFASGGKRMAVLDGSLNVVFERHRGPHGSPVATSGDGTDRMLVLQRGRSRLEAWDVDEYVRGTRGADTPPPRRRRLVDPAYARTVTY